MAYGQQLLLLSMSTFTLQHGLTGRIILGEAIFVSVLAVTIFFSAPTNGLFYLAAGYFFGIWNGSVIAIGSTLAGSFFAWVFFKRSIGLRVEGKELDVNMFLLLVLLRCSPLVPSSLVNMFCAATGVRPLVFLTSTFLGTLPLILVYTLAASRLRGPIDAAILHSPEILTSLTVLCVLSLLGSLQPVRLFVSYLKERAA